MENPLQIKTLEPVKPFDKNTVLAEGRCEPKTFDMPLKKYRKKYVTEYVAALNSHYRDIIEANTNEIIKIGEAYSELADTYNSLLAQYNQLSSSYIILQEEKTKVADALINAENTAKDIVERAHEKAESERRALEEQSELLRVNIVDKNRHIRNMRIEVVQMYDSIKVQMEEALRAITEKMDEEMKAFDRTVSSVEIKYASADINTANIDTSQNTEHSNFDETAHKE